MAAELTLYCTKTESWLIQMATMRLIMVKVKHSGHSTYWPAGMIPTEPDEETLVAALHPEARKSYMVIF